MVLFIKLKGSFVLWKDYIEFVDRKSSELIINVINQLKRLV